jgi:hypothetical protein
MVGVGDLFPLRAGVDDNCYARPDLGAGVETFQEGEDGADVVKLPPPHSHV